MSKIKKNIVLIFIFLATYQIILQASDKYAGAFLNNGVSARGIALGKTSFINNFDASSLYWNPALLNNLKGRNISLMLSQPFDKINDIQYHTLFFENDLFQGKFGTGLIYESVGDMKKADKDGKLLGTFDAKEIAFLMGYSKNFSNNFNGGFNIKIINQKFESYSGTAFGADLGLKYSYQKNLNFGLSLKNLIPPRMKVNSKKETFPLRGELGGNFDFFENLGIYYGISLESSELSHHTGIEYLFHKLLDVRVGYDDETESFTAGIGLKFNTLQLDYSYKDHKDLGSTHIVSLNVLNF